MENQKKGVGKIIIIIILLLVLLGLGGYITYDKMAENSKTDSLEKEVKQLNNEITTLKKEKQEKDVKQTENNENSISNENNNYINAVYYGYKEDATNNNYPKEFLALFSDGTFTDLFVDAGGSAGTYEIKDNQLILHRGNGDGPSTGDSTCEISQDRKAITKNGILLSNYK